MGCCQSIKIFPETFEKRPNYKAVIKVTTWHKDTNSLFDYESKSVTRYNFTAQNSGIIIRQGINDIYYHTQSITNDPNNNSAIQPPGEKILYLDLDEGYCWNNMKFHEKNFNKDNSSDQAEKKTDNRVWYVVNSMNTDKGIKGFRLNTNDIIRFGKVKFRITKISPYDKSRSISLEKPSSLSSARGIRIREIEREREEYENNHHELHYLNSIKRSNSMPYHLSGTYESLISNPNLIQKMNEENLACRICLGDTCDDEIENPIIQPCKCTGTMKYIHLECLKSWIKKQVLIKQSQNLISYYWKELKCELCQEPLQEEMICCNKETPLIDMPIVDQPHLVIESYMNDRSKGFHLIRFSESKYQIKLGRGFNCDIRINDISVSRNHASIKLEKGNFYLQDIGSKFGTLILAQKKGILFSSYKQFSIQIGRTLLDLKVIKNGSGLFCKRKIKKKMSNQPASQNSINLDNATDNQNLIKSTTNLLIDKTCSTIKPSSGIDSTSNQIDITNQYSISHVNHISSSSNARLLRNLNDIGGATTIRSNYISLNNTHVNNNGNNSGYGAYGDSGVGDVGGIGGGGLGGNSGADGGISSGVDGNINQNIELFESQIINFSPNNELGR